MKLVVFLVGISLCAQVAQKANERYKTEQSRREIVRTLTDPSRDARQRPKELIGAIGVKSGMTVVDLGTGPGYMLPHLSAAVGASGVVIGEDIFPDFLAKARENTAALKNVRLVQGTDKDTKLEAALAELILVLDVYHHLDYPADTLAQLRRALKPGGRLAIVEYHKNDIATDGRAKEHVRLTQADAIAEVEKNGFRLVSKRDFVPDVQWLGLFEVSPTRNQ